MPSVPDTPGVVWDAAPEPRKLGNYRSFVDSQRRLLEYNAAAYINKRVSKGNKFSGSTLKKVMKIATFLPAHKTRYSSGDFQVENMKYFVLHRPGRNPKASTLLNVIREFSQKNRAASTHFIVGFNGEIIQMVDLQDVSFHVGGSIMPDGKKGGNYNSVGVEIEGAVGERFTFAQYTAVAKIIGILNDISGFLPKNNLSKYIIEARKVLIGHEEIMPLEKVDPGRNFNYALLAHLLRDTAKTVKSEWYRSPVDALTSVNSALQQILFQAANPGSATEAATLNMTSGTTLAHARQLYMQYGGREDLAGWAANTAQQQSQSMAENLADQMQQMMRLASLIPPLPSSCIPPLLNFDSGMYTDDLDSDLRGKKEE